MNKYKSIVFVLAATLFLASCQDEIGPVITDPTPPVITAPAAGLSLEFTEANAQEVVTFAWAAASNYGFAAAVTYKVEMSLPGEDFAKPAAIVTTSELTATLTYGELNNLMMAAELAPGAVSVLQFRIAASVSDKLPSVYSSVLDLGAKPYRVVVNYPKLQVPGSYQGWNPAAGPVLTSLQSDGMYEGYIWFADAGTQFKFTDGPSWTTNWGDNGPDGKLDPNGDNIVAAEAGYYKINVNLPALTYTYEKTEWGVIGSATAGGWDNDQNMVFSAEAGTWSVTLDLSAGEIKFRANDAWGINFGDNKTNLSLEYGGANIPVATAGTYLIILDLRGPIYTYSITKQ